MNARRVIIFVLLALRTSAASDLASFRPTALRCEALRNPIGIDRRKPLLSWVLKPEANARRNQGQSAYQVLAATSRYQLDSGTADLWDSGKIRSDQHLHIRYAGAPLDSRNACFWKVRAWDLEDKVSGWSETAHWSLGLLEDTNWTGKWIAASDPKEIKAEYLKDAFWIWFPEGQPEVTAPMGTRFFRRIFDLAFDQRVEEATLVFTADDSVEIFVNGEKAGSSKDWHRVFERDISPMLHPGRNFLAAAVKNGDSKPDAAGFIASLRVKFAEGQPFALGTDRHWKSSNHAFGGWTKERFDERGWVPARELGRPGMPPWGDPTASQDRRLPGRMFRQEFLVRPTVARAMAYMSGLGLSELQINGTKAGDHALSPALSDYSKRVYYVAHDITHQLRPGTNAAGVFLGNGRFYAPRLHVPTETVSYGFPQLLLQIEINYEDGTREEIVSDERWRVTMTGPIRANNEYDGEEYDARREMKGWSEAGFDDSKWKRAAVVEPPRGRLSAEMIEPIRVTETIEPVGVIETLRGSYVFDFGQNIAGWCRLRTEGRNGSEIQLRYAERADPDRRINTENLRSARATDKYVLAGEGIEDYEPRFTTHGFRYVELSSSPGQPSFCKLQGRVVHDDLEKAGDFFCSNPLLNRIYSNMVWGVRGNYRSIPIDCPQRDERQGWLGDRAAVSRGETFLFDTEAFYSKWLNDIADAQKSDGSLPDVCPAYWPIYSDNVTWPSAALRLPGMLHEQYGNLEAMQNHYEQFKKWLNYMHRFATNGIISRDSYGDWCVPPEKPELIQTKDPKRKTRKPLLATAVYYYDLMLMQHYATLLGKPGDARQFEKHSAELCTAFNKKFFKSRKGIYENGSQTSCVLPLAFGLTPAGGRLPVFDRLQRSIVEDFQGHIGTGLIGCQWLMHVLSSNGRPDLAYSLATQTTYPSWGYMVNHGATTIWELWNGDTAEASMNSGNHLMLIGDLLSWMYEDLAGIKADPQQPGFKHIVMKPGPVGDLRFVQATHNSPFGLIKSDWRKEGRNFLWKVSIPVNSTATVYVPAVGADSVFESGLAATKAAGVKFLKIEGDRALFRLGSGDYIFNSQQSHDQNN